jgi:hypothetical protein
MASALLTLVLDDVKLGAAIARLSKLYFRAGDLNMGGQMRADAEFCHASATRSAARLHLEDKPGAEQQLKKLRIAINELGTMRCFHESRLPAQDFGASILHN